MKYLPLIWSGIWRKPGRTILIFLQVAVAFVLFGVLQGLKTGIRHAVDAARADLLIVHGRQDFIFSGLPLGLLEQIRSVPGIKLVAPVELFGSYYQKPENGMLIVAVRPDRDWTDAFTFNVAPDQLAAFWRPYIEPCIELFGPERCTFESNFPVDKMGIGYAALWNAFKRIAANASADEKAALFSGTARRVYRLN